MKGENSVTKTESKKSPNLDLENSSPPYQQRSSRVKNLKLNAHMPLIVHEKLGTGAKGTVVYCSSDCGPYALKIYHQYSESQNSQIQEIIDLYSGLNQFPFVPRIHARGEVKIHGDPRYYLLMDLVEGNTPQQLWDQAVYRGCILPSDISTYIVAKAASQLAQIINEHNGNQGNQHHRDISEENEIITYGGDVMLLDFECGIPSLESKLVGRLEKMLPELLERTIYDDYDVKVIRENNLYNKADTRALAVTLYKLLTGINPFSVHKPNTLSKLEQVKLQYEASLKPLPDLTSDKTLKLIPKGLVPILQAALNPDSSQVPLKRELANQLNGHIGDLDRRCPRIHKEGVGLWNFYFTYAAKAARRQLTSQEEERFERKFGPDPLNPAMQLHSNPDLKPLIDLVVRTSIQLGNPIKPQDVTYGTMQSLCDFKTVFGTKKVEGALDELLIEAETLPLETEKVKLEKRIERISYPVAKKRMRAQVAEQDKKIRNISKEIKARTYDAKFSQLVEILKQEQNSSALEKLTPKENANRVLHKRIERTLIP
ncbi:MAG: protein kinase domain-containing protein [Nanoarchaeota archaeon]